MIRERVVHQHLDGVLAAIQKSGDLHLSRWSDPHANLIAIHMDLSHRDHTAQV